MRSIVVMMQNNSICQHSFVFTANNEFQLCFKHGTIDHLSSILVVLEVGLTKVPKQCQHHFVGRRHTSEFLSPGQWHMFTLDALMFACVFMVVQACFITCDKPLQESLSFFTISLQELNSCFHVCPFVLIYKLLWHPPCTNFVIPKILVIDGICRSTADVQLVSCISDPAVLLNQSSNLFNIIQHLWNDWMAWVVFVNDACSATGTFSPIGMPLFT